MVEVLHLCGKIGVDDALRSELRDGYATWCSVDGQVSLYKQRVDTVSPWFACLVEIAVCA